MPCPYIEELGESDHSDPQRELIEYLGGKPAEQVFRTPPFRAIEILSKDDGASAMKKGLDDYRD
jgi:hypothetical protein